MCQMLCFDEPLTPLLDISKDLSALRLARISTKLEDNSRDNYIFIYSCRTFVQFKLI